VQIVLYILVLVAGFVLLIKGSDWFVEGASSLATRFGIPQIVIGLTIVAMGTSLPEASVSIAAALNGSAAISIGNIVGSNIINVCLILGITALLIKVPFEKDVSKVDMPFLLVITVLLLIMGITGHKIGRIEGIVMWLFFIGYLVYLFFRAKKNGGEEAAEDDKKPLSIGFIILFLVVGAAAVVAGSRLTVYSATELAKVFGISDRIIALTVVAFGTSLPELATSVTAALKKKSDIAVGNIVGSNIFNILFVIGTTALISPVTFSPHFIIDTVISAVITLLFFALTLKNEYMYRRSGAFFLIGYAAYFVYLML